MAGLPRALRRKVGDLLGLVLRADQGPGHQRDEFAIRPAERDEADPAMVAARDGLEEAGIDHGLGHALELEALFVRLDRARHVDRGDQIGIGGFSRRHRPDQQGEQAY
jgi:hypothetical protein